MVFLHKVQKNSCNLLNEGVGYGMEMDSYKSQILDSVLMSSGTKTKLYKLVSQIACVSVSIFLYKMYTFPHTWAQGGSTYFGTLVVFFVVSADCRLVQIHIY